MDPGQCKRLLCLLLVFFTTSCLGETREHIGTSPVTENEDSLVLDESVLASSRPALQADDPEWRRSSLPAELLTHWESLYAYTSAENSHTPGLETETNTQKEKQVLQYPKSGQTETQTQQPVLVASFSNKSMTTTGEQTNETIHYEHVAEDNSSWKLWSFLLPTWTWQGTPSQAGTTSPRCSIYVLDTDTIANCSYRNLTRVPHEAIPVTVTHLYLEGNNISTLLNYSFTNFTLLKVLDLSGSELSQLEEFSLSGLKNLKVLNLSRNNLAMSDTTFPESIFSSLVSLEELKINANNKHCKYPQGLNYPEKALSHLKSLTTLYMDGLNGIDFGQGFQKLRYLTNLSLIGYRLGCCHLDGLRNTTFKNLSQLKFLNITTCAIPGSMIDPAAFSPLQNLVSLDLSHNEDIDIDNLDKVFYGLRNITTLRELRMKLIVNRYSIGICLDSSYISNLPQHLEYLDVRENSIEGVDRHVIGRLPPSLKVLDVSGNKFVFGTYLQDLYLMKNLTTLNINGGGFIYKLPDWFPYRVLREGSQSNCTLYGDDDQTRINAPKFTVRLPSNLQTIDMNGAGLTYILSNLTFHPDNRLKRLSMSKNVFPDLIGPFEGLHSLQYLDLSSSYVKTISMKFFRSLSSLEVVKLDTNLLGDFFSQQNQPPVFQSLGRLKYLDLSLNDIRSLSPNMFSGLNSLRHLFLKRNPFTEFSANISHMQDLTLLNLTRSKVSRLPAAVQDHIDSLIRRGKRVTIDMSLCPISCNCPNLSFLIWMKTSGVSVHVSSEYLCVYDDGSSKPITDGYNSTIASLTRQCSSNTLLFLCVAGAMVIVFCVILCSVLYQFRWKIRYLYYAAHTFYRSTNKVKDNKEFEYDAFISYDEKDESFVVGKMTRELEKRGLKLCIHGRDFRAGDYIASNIVRAVCASRRTVVVLTRHMMDSYWCRYEIQMANMEAVYTGRQVLLFLLMEAIPHGTLGKELLYYIKNNTYIPYPTNLPDATSMGKLWDKLVDDVRD